MSEHGLNSRVDRAINYLLTPTTEAFHRDRESTAKFLTSAVGQGKTTSCLMEMLFVAQAQHPAPNGIRYTRFGILRNTNKMLKTTVLKTLIEWFPSALYTLKESPPITATFSFPLGDGTRVFSEWLFFSMDDHERGLGDLLSLELTGAFLSEVSELDFRIIANVLQRTRYPHIHLGGTRMDVHQVLADFNPIGIDSDLYLHLVKEPKPGYALYAMEPPLLQVMKADGSGYEWVPNPHGEGINFNAQGINYWLKQLASAPDEAWIKRFLGGMWADSFDGKPVWPNFSAQFHVARRPLRPLHAVPLIIGVDLGLSPGVVYGQLSGQGVTVYSETAPVDRCLEELIEDDILPTLTNQYREQRPVVTYDRAGLGRSGFDKMNAAMMFRRYGLTAFPSKTNEIAPRLNAVDYFLRRRSGLTVAPACTQLVKAMSGGYKWAEDHRGNSLYRPDKNKFSHIADAMQYFCLFAKDGYSEYRGATTQTAAEPVVPKHRRRYA